MNRNPVNKWTKETRPINNGRPKGVPNKINGQIRAMIYQALEMNGGADYLAEQAQKNPVAFMALLGRILPMEVSGVDGEAVQVTVVTGVPRGDPTD